jgi:ribosomal protein S18 acetylase RimI-like enzyme
MRITKRCDFEKLEDLLNADPEHPHIHIVDMPYRIASIWQDHGCEIGIWERAGKVVAWAIFQPAWWNLDFVVHPAMRGSELEQEIFLWGKDQMLKYSRRTGEEFWGSVEIFEDRPDAARTIRNLEMIGFTPFDWSIYRLELDATKKLPPTQIPGGYKVRPLRGESEIQAYVNLHRAAFGSERMTTAWRKRIMQQPAYKSEIDLVIENSDNVPVGFCVCWLREDEGQIEPLGIHPDYQGIGLGKALELCAYRTLKNHGARKIKVDHASSNENAIALSQKTGFCQRNNALRYYIDVKCQ